MNPLHKILANGIVDFGAKYGIQIDNAMIAPVPAHERHFHAGTAIALKLARELRKPPFEIAEELSAFLITFPDIYKAEAARPGYVNVVFSTDSISDALSEPFLPKHSGRTTVIDFGGPNIKPMHVGHLRSLVIGESLRRILQLTDNVISDIHWGDWGLPSGMILSELQTTFPNHAWFTCPDDGPYPDSLPCTPEEIGNIYPRASARATADVDFMKQARDTTRLLQLGNPRMKALWSSLSCAAKLVILQTTNRLDAHFDLLLGESDAEVWMPEMLDIARKNSSCVEEDGALTIHVKKDSDLKEMPPLILQRADGSSLYAASDLATILQRKKEYSPDRIIYVVDERQHLHFEQVFRAASLMGLSGDTHLVHRGFGTVNGPDGKPFRTRSGGVMPLDELLEQVVGAALERINETGFIDPHYRQQAAERIGLAALRVADLQQPAKGGYSLDMQKAVRFEGNTGPYLLYAAVRLRSAVSKSDMKDGTDVKLAITGQGQAAEAARNLSIALCDYPAALASAAIELEPSRVTRWAFTVADAIGVYWKHCPIASEPDMNIRKARTALATMTLIRLEHALGLLGCTIPEAM